MANPNIYFLIGVGCCFIGIILLIDYVIYEHRKKSINEKFREEIETFISHLQKFDMDHNEILNELSKFKTYKSLKKHNKYLKKVIKNYQL